LQYVADEDSSPFQSMLGYKKVFVGPRVQ